MKKNMYSLILSEDVVAEIDKLAYEARTNRSNMINRILAEYVSYTTPEKHVEQIFGYLEDIVSSLKSFQILQTESQHAFQMRTALAFKYNPSIRYNVEIQGNGNSQIGQIKISLRTQNESLIMCLLDFFGLYHKLESAYSNSPGYIDDLKYVKTITIKEGEEADANSIANAISDYINVFDKAIKEYFYNLPYTDVANAYVKKTYTDYIKTKPVIE